jgi:hypothetical protein
MSSSDALLAARCNFPAVPGGTEVLTPSLCAAVAELHDRFAPRVAWARATRLARVRAAVASGTMPGPPPPSLARKSTNVCEQAL